ncbi:MAG: TonB-dependent receptor, partial [Saprospiraceae bacterium]
MKHFLLSSLALLSLAGTLSAQKISGTVEQSGAVPAEFATVTLLQASDSSLVKGTVTGTDGTFELRGLATGRYLLRANLIGAGDAFLPAFNYDGGNLSLDKLTLLTDATALAQVTVVARRPIVEVQADKTILNVEGTVNSTGLSALELLRKAPGVTVDNNDNVNVKGKNQVKIMIDGRDVPLDGKDLAALLKGTQAADINSIEIISNPSAKYDASGNAGIINIRLKKNKAIGTNGNFGVEGIYGQTVKGGLNLSLNHREKSMNIFGSYNNSYGDWHNENNFIREQNDSVFDQQALQYNQSRWNSARVGADWFINDKNTVGVLLNGSYNPGDWISESRAAISSIANRQHIDTWLIASNRSDINNRDFNGNLNYRFADTSGHSLNLDFDRGVYRLRNESFQPNYYRAADGGKLLTEKIYRNNTPTDINIMTGKADYEQRLFKGTFGAGTKMSNVKTDNTFDFYKVIDGESVLDVNTSNRFIYEERTTAGYVNYNRSLGKMVKLQAGLRMENTDYTGDLKTMNGQDSTISKNYTEWFPSGALTFTFSPKIGLNATYSRRIDRPSYQDLNPFENKLDELTFQRGNPRLRPQFTNSFEIAPTYNGYPVVSFSYSHTKDMFTQVLDVDIKNPNATFITNENLAEQKNYTISLNAPTPIAKWWDGFVSLTGYKSHFNAQFREDFKVDKSYTAFNLYSEQTIKLPYKFSVQLSGWYNSAAFWGTLHSSPQGAMDFGIQKKVFDDKGELRLRFGDI